MKCDLCTQDASVFLTQIINGQMTTVNLCDACSKAKGVTDTMGFGLAEAFLGAPSSGTTQPIVSAPADSCPACGFTQAQLKKIGRMGCPDCYTAFRQNLDGLLAAMHKGTRHVGKTPDDPAPRRAFSREDAQRLIDRYRAQIQTAVAEERYEDAARFKAEIERLQRSLDTLE